MPGRIIALITLVSLSPSVWGQVIDKQIRDQVEDATVFIKFSAGFIKFGAKLSFFL